MLSVEELIAHLQTLPPKAIVLHYYCSDYSPLELKDIEVCRVADHDIARHEGHFMKVPKHWIEAGRVMEWVDVVIFPGI